MPPTTTTPAAPREPTANRTFRLPDSTLQQLDAVQRRLQAPSRTEALRRIVQAAACAPPDVLAALLAGVLRNA